MIEAFSSVCAFGARYFWLVLTACHRYQLTHLRFTVAVVPSDNGAVNSSSYGGRGGSSAVGLPVPCSHAGGRGNETPSATLPTEATPLYLEEPLPTTNLSQTPPLVVATPRATPSMPMETKVTLSGLAPELSDFWQSFLLPLLCRSPTSICIVMISHFPDFLFVNYLYISIAVTDDGVLAICASCLGAVSLVYTSYRQLNAITPSSMILHTRTVGLDAPIGDHTTELYCSCAGQVSAHREYQREAISVLLIRKGSSCSPAALPAQYIRSL